MADHRAASMRRRMFALVLLGALALLAACTQPAGTPPRAARAAEPLVTEVGAIGITVGDLDRSIAFYTTVLQFQKVSEVELEGPAYDRLRGVAGARLRVAYLRLGDETIDLTEYRAPKWRPIPADSRSNDRWFQHIAIIVSDMDRAYATLRSHGVEHVSPAPQRLPDWNPAAGGIRAFYFKDPDGHPLEILHFPSGKGDPRWHRPSDRLFLGIDHTAIAVADTAASLAFYRDTLGMRIAGTSENWGPEQEHLNAVAGARLRFTTLKAASGPGVELLEYLTPRDGRRLTAPQANDLTHWEIGVVAPDVRRSAAALRATGAAFVSGDAITITEPSAASRDTLIVRDPDGHALRLSATRGR